MSPELSFLIDISLADQSGPPSENLNWERLYRLAQWHRIRPLLSNGLSRTGIGAPTQWNDQLQVFRRQQSMYSLLLFEKTIKIYRKLAEANLQIYPMKGTIWAGLYFGDPGMREFGDIDFFVQESDLPAALEIMAGLGYKPDPYRTFLLSRDRNGTSYRATDYQLPLASEDDPEGELIELQWNVSYPRFAYSFTWKELMENAVSHILMGVDLKLPRPEHQLLLMIIHHGGIEQWDRLKYVADLIFFLRKHSASLDWKYVNTKAREKGIWKLVVAGLSLAEGISSTFDLPVFIKEALESSYLSKETIYDHWEKGREAPLTKSVQILKYNFKHRDRFSDRLRILAGHAAYLSNFRLLWNKIDWYFFNKH